MRLNGVLHVGRFGTVVGPILLCFISIDPLDLWIQLRREPERADAKGAGKLLNKRKACDCRWL